MRMALDTMRDRDATAAAPDGPAALGERLLDAAAAAACLDDTASSSNGEAPAPAARLRRRSLRERLLAEEAGEEDEGEGGAPRLPPGAPGPAPVRLLQDAATLVRLTLRLYARLWTGARWLFMFWRLLAFAALLAPGFAQMAAFYFLSPRLLRSVEYGPRPRNRLDVYLPRRRYRTAGAKAPVVIYVTGGAWLIGYKAWGALIGRRLSQRGALVFCLDYRNFPQGRALDMLEDVNAGVAWALAHAERYGGDAGRVHLVGQSAGGHLTALALLAQAARVAADEDAGGSAAAEGGAAAGAADGAANGACALPQHQQRAHQQKPPLPPPLGASPPWDPRRLRAYAAVSGTYDLEALVDHLHGRGLYRPLFLDIMAGPDGATGAAALRALSPTAAAAALAPAAAAALPPALLLHGGADRTVPAAHAAAFAAALRAAGAAARLVVYPGKTHTQPIVEDPMGGGRDELMDEILSLVRGRSCTTRQFAMCPAALIAAASYVSPF